MIRWGISVGVAVAIVWPQAALWPQDASAQVCRRVCKSTEVRDANRCCVSRATLNRRQPKGVLRLEADVSRARVTIGPKSFRTKLPANLRVPTGKHSVVVRAAGKVWRGAAEIKTGKSGRLFASVNGGEWPNKPAQAVRARAILDAALKAKGGAAKLRKLKSVRYFGRSSPDAKLWHNGTHLLSWVKPGRVHWQISQSRGTNAVTIIATTPTRRWVSTDTNVGRHVRSTPAEQSDRTMLWQFPVHILLRHTERGTRVALLPAAVIDGNRVDVVQIAKANGSARARLYIDQKSRMLARYEWIKPTGSFFSPTNLSDYRRVGGIAFAYRWGFWNMNMDWTRIALDQPVGKGLFNVPAQLTRSNKRAGSVRVRERLFYKSTEPVLAKLNKDRVPDFIGWCDYRRYDYFPAGKVDLHRADYVCAVDGRTFKELWRIGPFKRGPTLLAVRRNKLVVSHHVKRSHTVVDVYDLSSRKRVRRFTLTAQAKRQCLEPGGKRVLLRAIDGNHRIIDPATATIRKTTNSKWCVRRWCERNGRSARCLTRIDKDALRTVPGVNHTYALATARERVVFGHKKSRPAWPMMGGYDARGKMLWHRRVLRDGSRHDAPKATDVLGGTVYIGYDLPRRGVKVVALSARTGKVLWRSKVPLKRIFRLVAKGGRIYVTGTSKARMVVVGRRSGRLIGTFGYEDKRSRRPLRSGER